MVFFVLALVSCNQVKLSDARAQYLRGEYFDASETYRKLYRETSREQRAMRGVIAYEMAENYRKLNQSARAATSYANAIRYSYPDTTMLLSYAQMLHREGKYVQAAEQYREFLNLKPDNRLAIAGLEGAQNAISLNENPTRYIVKRMDVFNSRRGEFSPMLAENDGVLYFTSSRDEARGDINSPITGMKYNDFFFSKKNEQGEWKKPEIIDSEINTDFDEGAPSFSANGEFMYYTFSAASESKPTTTQIYFSRKAGGTWTAGQQLKVVPRDTLSVFAHPSVSPSGDFLYFVSDMPGGYGGKDIWRAAISENEKVLYVENLGPEVNTPGNELFPYMKNDSLFYFASDGHPGMGGLDIFEAAQNRNFNKWDVRNMGVPINSSADDFGITFEQQKEKGFFSSNRGDARGYDHIYSFEYPDVSVFVEGLVVDKEDAFISEANITVIGKNGTQQQFTTNKNGTYRFRPERGVDYVFMASAEGFLNMKKTLRTSTLEKDTVYYVDFEMTPYNKPVILENIFYDFDKATLRPESKTELDGLIALLTEHPEISIELSAHTDRKGSDKYNRNLSLRRAQSVVHYLISQGIDADRLSAAGYGKQYPKTISASIAKQFSFLPENTVLNPEFIETLTPEQQDVADQINRRTEFKILEEGFGLR